MIDIDVSVIIPVYKTEKFIKSCLRSVFAHTDAPNFEVIIVDDASPDNSIQIASSFSGIKIIRHETNRGLSEARNTGIRAARGKYLYFVDSDDTLGHNALIRLWKHVVAHPGVNIVYGTTASTPSDKKFDDYFSLERAGAKAFDTNPGDIKRVHSKLPEIAMNKLIRREWLEENNLYFTPGLIHEDLDWHLRAYGRVGSYAADFGTPTYLYGLRPDSITGAQQAEKKSRTVMEILLANTPGLTIADAPVLDKIGRLLIHHSRTLEKGRRHLLKDILHVLCSRDDISRRNKRIMKLIRIYPKRFHPALLTKWLR